MFRSNSFGFLILLCTLVNVGLVFHEELKPRPATMSNRELRNCLIVASCLLEWDTNEGIGRDALEMLCEKDGCLPWNVEAVLSQIRPLLRQK